MDDSGQDLFAIKDIGGPHGERLIRSEGSIALTHQCSFLGCEQSIRL
jgi:hypothetical protein